jgi:hypothetical protein
MLSEAEYQEAVRRYKNMKVNGHERQRYHALILVHHGYSYWEVGCILLVDEDTIGRWVRRYQEGGLRSLKNDGQWGGEHGQREIGPEEVSVAPFSDSPRSECYGKGRMSASRRISQTA